MELINQHVKGIMEDCKVRARRYGLNFGRDPEGRERPWESLEYIVTNRDLVKLSPKIMIPTLYDFWMHDVEVIAGQKEYEIYPHNPYETVINTSPAISFYNDNNPDWLNVMIFYHVIGHIDFFRNNRLFERTWSGDFCAQALDDKRTIEKLRVEKGEDKRWVDYFIEFSRAIDNLVAFFPELDNKEGLVRKKMSRFNFYFGPFMSEQKITQDKYLKELKRYNREIGQHGEELGAKAFFIDPSFRSKHPEFEEKYRKFTKKQAEIPRVRDIMQYIMEYSEFLNKPANRWIKTVVEIIRRTSLAIAQPQIRTKIMNEGWASYWHQKLFMADERIGGNEVNFARINAGVVSMPRVGLNPYALGLKLLEFIEEMADKGKLSPGYQRLAGYKERELFDRKTGKGQEFLFKARENLSDVGLITLLTPEDFQDFVTRNDLFVAGVRFNPERMTQQIYVKSRNGEDYRKMLLDTLYHPPAYTIDEKRASGGELYINHRFEGRPLITRWIPGALLKVERLWGRPVKLETTEIVAEKGQTQNAYALLWGGNGAPRQIKKIKRRVLYTCKDGKIAKAVL